MLLILSHFEWETYEILQYVLKTIKQNLQAHNELFI